MVGTILKKLNGEEKGAHPLPALPFQACFSPPAVAHPALSHTGLGEAPTETGGLTTTMAGRCGQFPKFIKAKSGHLGHTHARPQCSSTVNGTRRHEHPEGP